MKCILFFSQIPIYINSALHCLVEPDKMTKEIPLTTESVAWRVRRVVFVFGTTDPSSNPPFGSVHIFRIAKTMCGNH